MAESRSKLPPGMFSRTELLEIVNRCRMLEERTGGDLAAHLRRLGRAAQSFEDCLRERGYDGPQETALPGV